MKKIQTNTSQNIGSDSIPKLFAQLAIPAVVAQIINLLYNIVDRIYIGHIPEVGASALTGVGLFLPILMLINAFAILYNKLINCATTAGMANLANNFGILSEPMSCDAAVCIFSMFKILS